jgi:hypothetical protein
MRLSSFLDKKNIPTSRTTRTVVVLTIAIVSLILLITKISIASSISQTSVSVTTVPTTITSATTADERSETTQIKQLKQLFYTNIHPAAKICGSLCLIPRSWPTTKQQKTTAQSLIQSQIRNYEVNCNKLFSKEAAEVFDEGTTSWPPPKTLPEQYLDEFTLFGRVKISPNEKSELFPDGTYFAERTKDGDMTMHWPLWTEAKVKEWSDMATAGTLHGNYGPENSKAFLASCKVHLSTAKHVLVVGSLTPWVEAILLACGVEKITTMEYGELPNTHPKIRTMLPSEFAKEFLAGTLPKFDGVVSISSIEHSGLGRYGDQINPWGDIVAVARMSCVLKRNGILMLGLNDAERDEIVWNAHRIYGPFRWPLLLTNFRVIDVASLNDRWGQIVVTAVNEFGGN